MDRAKQIIKTIGDFFFMGEEKSNERYLAQSVDLIDLEHRMRKLQRHGNRNAFGMPIYVGH